MSSVLAVPVVFASNAFRFQISNDLSPFAPARPSLKHIISFAPAMEKINSNNFNLKSVYNNSAIQDPARFNTLKRVSKLLHKKRDDHSEERRGHMRLLLYLEDSFITLLSTQTYMKQPTQIQMKRLRTHIKSSEPKIIVKYDY